MNVFVEGIPVVSDSNAEKVALRFREYIRSKGLKGVNYRTGMKCGAWSLDVYLIPENEDKPYFQSNCNGEHIINLKYGYFVSGTDNQIINTIKKYMGVD